MKSITWAKMVSEGDRSETLITRITRTDSSQAPCDHCVTLEGERTSEQEETLNLLAKSQVIAPISIANLQFSHPGVALFYARTGGITSSRRITPRLQNQK